MSSQSAVQAPVALVTGGAVRVGRAIAIALAERGFDLCLTYRSHMDEAAEVVAEVEELGRRALALHADLTDPNAPKRVVAATRQALGPLDVLVNSAASFVFEPIPDVSLASFDRQFALNVRAPFFLAQAASRDLGRFGRGRVVNICDLGAERPFENQVVHSMTKAALLNMTLGLAAEMAPVTQVHAVIPGPVLMPEDWTEDQVAEVLERTPVGRVGSPDDVAEAVVYLATCSSFATGTVVHVDGGRHAVA